MISEQGNKHIYMLSWVYFGQHMHTDEHQLFFMASQFFSLGSGQKCRLFSFFSLKEMKGWQSEAGRLIKGHGGRWGQDWRPSCSCFTRMHYHSFTVCHPPLFCHSLSLFLPPTFSFHPRPTFLVAVVVAVVVVVGVVIRHGAQCEKHNAELGQILHAAQITLEDCATSQVRYTAHPFCNRLFCVSVVPCVLTTSQFACFPFWIVYPHIKAHTPISPSPCISQLSPSLRGKFCLDNH